MHRDRLAMLKRQHAPERAVTAFEARSDGTTTTMDCGHSYEGAPHFRQAPKTARCSQCGVAIVRQVYAHEFEMEVPAQPPAPCG